MPIAISMKYWFEVENHSRQAKELKWLFFKDSYVENVINIGLKIKPSNIGIIVNN